MRIRYIRKTTRLNCSQQKLVHRKVEFNQCSGMFALSWIERQGHLSFRECGSFVEWSIAKSKKAEDKLLPSFETSSIRRCLESCSAITLPMRIVVKFLRCVMKSIDWKSESLCYVIRKGVTFCHFFILLSIIFLWLLFGETKTRTKRLSLLKRGLIYSFTLFFFISVAFFLKIRASGGIQFLLHNKLNIKIICSNCENFS